MYVVCMTTCVTHSKRRRCHAWQFVVFWWWSIDLNEPTEYKMHNEWRVTMENQYHIRHMSCVFVASLEINKIIGKNHQTAQRRQQKKVWRRYNEHHTFIVSSVLCVRKMKPCDKFNELLNNWMAKYIGIFNRKIKSEINNHSWMDRYIISSMQLALEACAIIN